MITEALIATINPIVPAYSLNADMSEKLPLCVVGERHTPQYTKSGIIGYEGSGMLSVITRKHALTQALTYQVVNAFNALTGQTISGTTFKMFRTGEINIDYDPDDKAYYSELQFTFKTKNL
jgi:hypothetical protein